MLTDSPPRKANRAGFLESDRIRMLDLPQYGRSADHFTIHRIGNEIRDNCRCPTRLRRVSGSYIGVLQSPCLRHPSPCRKTAASPRTLDKRAFRGLQSRNHTDPGMDADGSAKGNHVLWNISEHPVPRILPPSRLSAFRIPGLMAHSRFLRANRCALPPCAGNAAKATNLGAYIEWAMAD